MKTKYIYIGLGLLVVGFLVWWFLIRDAAKAQADSGVLDADNTAIVYTAIPDGTTDMFILKYGLKDIPTNRAVLGLQQRLKMPKQNLKEDLGYFGYNTLKALKDKTGKDTITIAESKLLM